jgi:DNA-cytosine methyltransferase
VTFDQGAVAHTEDQRLATEIETSSGAEPVQTTLRTDQRVLARVTDGIYRQPGSALRELVSNAYDADARRVVIKTDRPRFNTISIEDDGLGMSPAIVAHLIRHIGGSAKRTAEGAGLGLTDAADATLSPGGRKLIGRIGIGLFSVAQLTDRFQIITKTGGDPFRTVATVVLKQFSEDADGSAGDDGYEAGKVNIWREPAVDEAARGTSIVLMDIRPQTRDTLRSRDLWAAVDADQALGPDESRGLKPPRFHIGRVDPDHPDVVRGEADAVDSVPWERGDSPDTAFKKLVSAVWAEAQQGAVPNPQLEQIFDYYLRMAWLQLGLAIPARYVDGHPFDIPFDGSVYAFQLPEDLRTPPKEVELSGSRTVREVLKLGAGSTEGDDFEVIVDDLRIERPLRFQHLPTTSHQVKKPILFTGHCREEFPTIPKALSSGPLEFDAYLLWAPKIVPTEHQGVLIRIHGSSGTLFDPTFMRYQVSELTRLRQVLSAPDAALEGLLRPGGLQAQRARYLRELLEAVRDDNAVRGVGPASGADLTLEYLHDLADGEVESFLDALPGIGKKSARCVMAYSLGRQSFAVDTHVERILTRLGLAPARKSKLDHESFQAIVPPKLRRQLHINLVHHGRAVCQSRARCQACVLVSFCAEGLASVAGGSDAPVAIDLFAGAGGLGSGFRQAGYRIALAVEKDRNAAQTYRANNPGVPVVEADVAAMTASRVRSLVPGLGEPDVVLAGPPCQGYSSAGARLPTDEKNLLFERVVTLAERLRAHFVVLENVPGLNRVNGVGFTARILGTLRRKYAADLHQITASSFGVPQNRRRYFFLARRKDLGDAPTCPPATHRAAGASGGDGVAGRETPRLQDVLAGPLELPSGTDAEYLVLEDGTHLLNASTMRHSDQVIDKMAAIEAGRGPISYRRLERDVARTLVAGHRALPVHPWLNRTISVREAARIQGFPDAYVFCGPRAEQPLQVANAVPPPVARAVAVHLRHLSS